MILLNLISRKICFQCREPKPVGEFYLRRGRHEQYQAECKSCTRTRRSKWWRSDAGRESSRNTKLKSRFGITNEQYAGMLASQDGKCLICGSTESTLGHRLAVDHDHKTGAIRALLCKSCNVGIGHLRDNPTLCENAAKYLRRFI